jgi:hypothetical protein
MQLSENRHNLAWLKELGFTDGELHELNPCVPGEFTMPEAFYINTGSPGVVYFGTEEGSLPLVAGKWYLIPSEVVDRRYGFGKDAVRVAKAPRLVG